MDLINWGIAREPVNWITVALMLLIVAVLLHVFMGTPQFPPL